MAYVISSFLIEVKSVINYFLELKGFVLNYPNNSSSLGESVIELEKKQHLYRLSRSGKTLLWV